MATKIIKKVAKLASVPPVCDTCRLQTCRLQTCRLADLLTCRLADLQTCRLQTADCDVGLVNFVRFPNKIERNRTQSNSIELLFGFDPERLTDCTADLQT